jgi:hypothetical protein
VPALKTRRRRHRAQTVEFASSLRLDVRRSNHVAPLRCFVGDQFTKVGGRSCYALFGGRRLRHRCLSSGTVGSTSQDRGARTFDLGRNFPRRVSFTFRASSTLAGGVRGEVLRSSASMKSTMHEPALRCDNSHRLCIRSRCETSRLCGRRRHFVYEEKRRPQHHI